MQKGDQHRWLWVMLLLSYKFLMVKGDRSCYCKDFRKCVFSETPFGYSWISSVSRINVALGKPSNQSSTWKLVNHPLCGNDGDKDWYFDPNPVCVHTSDYDRDPYYLINLLMAYPVNQIVIYWRNAFFHRHKYTRVLLDGNLCYKFMTDTMPNPSTVLCSVRRGQYVRLDKQYGDTGDIVSRSMNVCEVEVWVCWPGFWGGECEKPCDIPLCRDQRPCDPFTGQCSTPPEDIGFQGPVTKEVLVKPLTLTTKRPAIHIKAPDSVEATTTTTTIKPPEECLYWIYAICIIVVGILITVGIYLSLTYSKRAEGGQEPRRSTNPSVGEGGVENEDENIPE